jgi:iron(III) transport system substrate-binding protein
LDYLLTPEVEVRLARGASAQFPLHMDVDEQPRVHQEGIRPMEVDFQAAASEWNSAAEFLRNVFATAN